jgi:anaerobic carbon-monoxide dehydrogenase catalytic subunit
MEENFKKLNERLKEPPCPIGLKSLCCKHCLMGPCRLLHPGDVGACGANQDVISSRNLLRGVAAGTSAHTGHAWHLLEFLGKSFPNNYIEQKAPPYLIKTWEKLGIMPKIKFEHFKDISEAFHATTMGVNADYQDLLARAVKLGIIDGYLGLYLATELEDTNYHHHKQRKGKINLGVIKPEKINIAVHGHEPIFAEALVEEVKKSGNQDINLIGVCCTGASLLSRHGIPLAGNVVFQEEVISTGAIDVMAVDVQCIMPSLVDLSECYHTSLITTNPLGKIQGATHLPITDKSSSKKVAEQIIKTAKINFKKRDKNIVISDKEVEAVIGFDETIADSLAEKLKNKEIKGIIGVIGCKNPRVKEDWISTYNELSKDYAILCTGCMAFELGREGLLDGEKFFHLGSCVNNARIAEILKIISEKNKKRITDMPFLISAPAPLTEKCLAIGFFFAALGVDVHFGYPMMISMDSNMENFLKTVLKDYFESRIFLETNPKLFIQELKKSGF